MLGNSIENLNRIWEMACIQIISQSIGEEQQMGLGLESYIVVFSRILGQGSQLTILSISLRLFCRRSIEIMRIIRKMKYQPY